MKRSLAVSIIVVTKNVEPYVEQSIGSVLDQTLKDFELIIVDDESTDRTLEICERLARKDNRIRIVRREGGLGSARTTGLSNARGKYVYLIEGDALLLQNALETLYNAAEECGAEVIHSTMYFERMEVAHGEFDQRRGWLTADRNARITSCFIDGELDPLRGLNMYRREFVLSHMDRLEDKLSDDRLLFITLLSLAEKFYCVPDCLYVHAHRMPTLQNQTPDISVIVPVYNVERYVEGSINSILEQTFKDFEVIVVDDASPDRSIDICEQLARSDRRIKIVRHEFNQGLGAARNTGMEHARGKYVCFLDSDDVLVKDALEKFYRIAEENKAEVVHCMRWLEQLENKDGTLNRSLTVSVPPTSFIGFLIDDKNLRLQNFYVPQLIAPMAWLNFCRRDFLERHNIKFPAILSEDEAFNFALQRFADRFYCMPDPLCIYRKRMGSLINSLNPEKSKKCSASIVEGIKYIDRASGNHISMRIRNACVNTFVSQLLQNYILRYYNENEIFDIDLTRILIEALRPIFNDGTEIATHFLQGYAAQILWKNILQYRLLNIPTPPPISR